MKTASDFAHFVKGLGFKVYLAKAGHYGFITDSTEERVLSFSFSDGSSLSGNYGPPSRESGTGWRLEQSPHDLKTADDVRRALNAYPPAFCGKGWNYLTTVKQHLAIYGSSSEYTEV
jgi:hypothetical protein